MKALLVAVLGVLAGGRAYAQGPVPPIALDVVLDAPQARAASLAPSDFEVRAAGEVLQIQSVRLVQPSADQTPLPPIDTDDAEQRTAAVADRIVAVYLDEYHLVDDEAFVAARRALAAFLRSSLGVRDLVVVLKPLDSVVAIRLDTDRERAAAIVEAAQARQGDYTARSAFEQNFLAGSPAQVDATRRQIVMSGLGALASHLGRFAGRKTLIVLSNALPPRAAPVRGELPRGGVESLVRAANIGAVAVYPIRPTPPASIAGQSEDVLDGLASGTTGFVIRGREALAAGLSRLLGDASRYYLLTLQPPPDAGAERFRPVDVQVLRRGLAARVRGGFGVRGAEADRAMSAVRPLPEGLRVPRHASTLIRAWFGQSPGSDGRTLVDFVWEPAPRAGERATPPTPARLTMVVTTLEGEAIFSGESVPSTGEVAEGSSRRTHASFETPPGRLLVRMDILDLAGRVLDRDVRDLAVTGFTAPVSFGTAAVYRARTVRDLRAFGQDGAAPSPVAARRFSRAEHLIVRLPVVSAAPTDVTVRLLNAFGGVLREVPARPVPARPRLVQVELPLASLASATYVLEFRAAAGDASAVDRLEFSVTP